MLSAHLASPTPTPVPRPAKPAPYWSWDTLPIAYHGANRSGLYTPEAEAQLARYSLVTLEKWYTPCGAQGPTQAGPECDVEDRMFGTFQRIKALNPNVTTIMYLNSNFDFAFYALHGRMMAREAAGQPAYLRDMYGKVVELCNDGNVYCNITTFDHANQAVNELWTEALLNATKAGSVDGVFADHGSANPTPVASGDYAQMCNGRGAGRRCFNFTLDFAERFTAGHEWLLNHTQDVLAKSTGGPVICGHYANWHRPTEFAALRKDVQQGEAGTGPFVLEASSGACDLAADEAKLAGFLCAMGKYTYLACFSSQSGDAPLPRFYDAYSKPLGEPTGKAEETPAGSGSWSRVFRSAKGDTIARFNAVTGEGSVQWAGEPPPSPPPPFDCGAYSSSVLHDTTFAEDDVARSKLPSAGACCEACGANEKCVEWAYHAPGSEQDSQCHLHSKKAILHQQAGTQAGVMRRMVEVEN